MALLMEAERKEKGLEARKDLIEGKAGWKLT